MTLTVYFAAPSLWDEYRDLLPHLLKVAGIDARVVTEAPDPAAVDYIIYAPSAPLQDFTPFTRCKAVLNLWAGVERIVGNATLTQPLCRMVENGLTEGMVEWVVGHALRHHLGMDRHIVNPGHLWDATCPPLARERKVAMLGMGALGTACAQALAALNFAVVGWSRTEKATAGIQGFHGEAGLEAALRGRGYRRDLAAENARNRKYPERRTAVMAETRCVYPEPRTRAADRRCGLAGGTGQRPDRPCHAGCVPDRAPAAGSSILEPPRRHRHAAYRG